jgi:RNA polymerase sigma-70 factor (ECF subfamily)
MGLATGRIASAPDRATDECLLERTRRGDETAFMELYRRHRDATFRFACRMLGSPEQAEDVAHDCFLGLIRNPGRFDPRRASLRAYLYGAVRNLSLKRLRRLGSERRGEEASSQEIPARDEEPLHGLLAQELSAKVHAAIAGMRAEQREVILLFEYEGQSLAEIAAIIGTDVGTVKWRLHQARGWLRKELAPYLNGGTVRRKENERNE